MKKIVLSLFLLFCVLISAQTDSLTSKPGSRSWMGIGLGLGNIVSTEHECTVLGFNFNHSSSGKIYKARYVNLDEFVFIDFGNSPPSDKMWEAGLLFGLSKHNARSEVSISTGISYVRGKKYKHTDVYPNYKRIDISTAGLPIEAQAVFSFTRDLGMSILLFGDINSEYNIFGAQFSLIVGKLR